MLRDLCAITEVLADVDADGQEAEVQNKLQYVKIICRINFNHNCQLIASIHVQ